MKIKVNIHIKDSNNKIAEFKTSSKNIQSAFYTWISKRYELLKVTPSECYYKLSN